MNTKINAFYNVSLKTILIGLFIAMNALFTACGSDDAQQLGFVDVSGARYLFSGTPAPRASLSLVSQVNPLRQVEGDNSTSTLFKIKDDGSVEAVQYRDKDGNEMASPRSPIAVYSLKRSDYLIMVFADDWSDAGNCYLADGYLVRKSDGAAFSMSAAGVPCIPDGHFSNARVVYEDTAGNIYFLKSAQYRDYVAAQNPDPLMRNNNRIAVKINISDPNSITAEYFTPTDADVIAFAVDSAGYALYKSFPVNDPRGPVESSNTRGKSPSGAIQPIAGCYPFWAGLDGELYCSMGKQLVKVSHSDWSASNYGAPLTTELAYMSGAFTYHWLETETKIFLANSSALFEIFNSEQSPKELSSLDMTIAHTGVSGTSLYVAGTDATGKSVIKKIDTQHENSVTTVFSGLYDIYKMSVGTGDELVFSGLRLSDAKKILAKISAAGELTILQETSDQNLAILQRVR